MRKFHQFVLIVSISLFIVSFALALGNTTPINECYNPNMAMTKIC